MSEKINCFKIKNDYSKIYLICKIIKMSEIIIKKDWEWYIAEVKWSKNLYAFGYSEAEAKTELLNVVEMMMDFHLELVEKERQLKHQLLWNNVVDYAL